MLSSIEFIRQSLGLHLFFARIMKEHATFLEAGFTPKNSNLSHQADEFKMQFDRLLAEVVSVSNGIISQAVINSGEIVTPFTLKAEAATQYYTGIPIQTSITQAELGLMGDGHFMVTPMIEQKVFLLNQTATRLIDAIIRFKVKILSDVLSCKMFTMNYPLLIDHILREARLYLKMVQRLQSREEIDLEKEALEQESFWNRIMAEHSKFIRGLLDPTEEALIETANNFGREFDELTKEAQEAMEKTIPISKVTDESLKATTDIKDFNTKGTQGLINCKIKSIILPLLGDHVLRESNHYLRLLNMFEKGL